jgi:hypothetical protein
MLLTPALAISPYLFQRGYSDRGREPQFGHHFRRIIWRKTYGEALGFAPGAGAGQRSRRAYEKATAELALALSTSARPNLELQRRVPLGVAKLSCSAYWRVRWPGYYLIGCDKVHYHNICRYKTTVGNC